MIDKIMKLYSIGYCIYDWLCRTVENPQSNIVTKISFGN